MWLLGATVALSGLVAYGVWSARATAADLDAARGDAQRLQTAMSAEDVAGSRTALTALETHISAARGRTDGPLWGLASHLPIVGGDVRAVQVVAAVGDDLTKGTLAELVDEAGSDLRDRLAPHGGRIDIAAVEEVAPLVGRADRNLNAAAGRLRAIDRDSLSHWVKPSYEEFSSVIATASTSLAAANRAVQVLPTMLGKDRPRRYLLMFENNAEIRATGGLPGAYGLVTADRGKITLTEQGVPGDIGKFPEPVLPQSEAEKEIYFSQIAEYFQDTNFTPEFPRTAELVREMWKRSKGVRLDGVMSVDVVSLSYLLRATGPVDAPGAVRLTDKNATEELINRVYFRLPNSAKQDAYFKNVAKLIFERVSAGVDSTTTFLTALGQAATEGRIYIHDFDNNVQRALSGTTVAGELQGGDPRVPQVGVYLNDATGSKMSFYLRSRVRLRAEGCASRQQQLSGFADLTYTKDSPPVADLNDFVTGTGGFGTPQGEQLVVMRVYGPAGGSVSNFRFDGKPLQLDTVDDRGRQVATVVAQLSRGQTVRVAWRVRSDVGQDRPARLTVTPGLTQTPSVRQVPTSCAGS